MDCKKKGCSSSLELSRPASTLKDSSILISTRPVPNTDTGEMNAAATGMDDDACAICLGNIRHGKTLKCRHSFCTECIETSFKYKPACPICKTFYGIHIGTQPEGTMTVARTWQRLPGFENCGTIVIEYRFPAGIQGPEHPNPGEKYASTSRTAFLPACDEGEKVLRLLRKAFERRLIFTIGRSVTTGLNNSVTWNDIHHKTSMNGGPQRFGYPDPDYLSRVQEELRLKGVTEDS